MKAPGEDTTRLIFAGVIVVCVIALVWYAVHTKNKAKTADALTDKVEVLQDSGEISRKANEQAGTIMGKLGRKASKDREIVNAARHSGTTADADRVQRRAFEAYAEGQRASCRLQRTDCGPAAAGATED